MKKLNLLMVFFLGLFLVGQLSTQAACSHDGQVQDSKIAPQTDCPHHQKAPDKATSSSSGNHQSCLHLCCSQFSWEQDEQGIRHFEILLGSLSFTFIQRPYPKIVFEDERPPINSNNEFRFV